MVTVEDDENVCVLCVKRERKWL